MKGKTSTILFLQMEDYDNPGDPDNDENLIEQIHAFNEENDTQFSDHMLRQYKNWQKDKYTKEPRS